jgi:hypothetical protein
MTSADLGQSGGLYSEWSKDGSTIVVIADGSGFTSISVTFA